MKFIYPNEISAVSMTNEDSDYPDSNVLTEYPKQVAKSTGTSTTFTCTVDASSAAVFIFNCNATDVDVSVGATPYGQNLNPSTYDYLSDGSGKIWDDTGESGSHTLTIAMSVGSGVVEVGGIYSGPVLEYTNPLKNMSYGRQDLSVIRELNQKGAMYIVDGDQKATWAFDMIEDYTTDFWEFWDNIVGLNKLHPLPCMFSEDDYRHTVYARLNDRRLPQSTFGEMTDHGRISMEFIEVN